NLAPVLLRLGTGVLRGGANYRGMRDAGCVRSSSHPASRISHPVLLRALSQPYRSVHRLEGESPPPAPDRPVQAAGPEASGDHEWEIGLDVAVDGLGADLGGQTGRQIDGDPTVDRAELEDIAPRGAAERSHDLAVHRLRLGVAGGGNPDAAVHRVRF